MDISLANGLPQIGVEDPNTIMNPLHGEMEFKSSYSAETCSGYPNFNPQSSEGEMLMMKTDYESYNCSPKQMISTNYINASTSISKSNVIAFGDPNSPPLLEQHQSYGILDLPISLNDEPVPPQEIFKFARNMSQASLSRSDASEVGDQKNKMNNISTINKSPLQVQERVMAERLRREKLNKLFIDLSANIAGLKKLDKASILQEAVEYIKQLQAREKVLEEEANMQQLLEQSTLLLSNKKTTIISDKQDTNPLQSSSSPVLQVSAKVCDQDVLIRIHCKKPKAIILNLLAELEKLYLTIINCSVIPFHQNLDITIIAQRGVKFCVTRNELMEEVRAALLKLM